MPEKQDLIFYIPSITQLIPPISNVVPRLLLELTPNTTHFFCCKPYKAEVQTLSFSGLGYYLFYNRAVALNLTRRGTLFKEV